MGYGSVAWFVCVYLLGGAVQWGCCCPVLTGTAVTTGVVSCVQLRGYLSMWCNLLERDTEYNRTRTMKIDRESFGKFFDGTSGKTWDDYAARLRNAGAGEIDDRGYSIADEYDGTAEGGPLCPPMPAAPAQLLKAQAARRRRQKESYSLS